MQLSWKSISAVLTVISLLVVTGCNRGGDTSQPTASVNGPGTDKGSATLPKSDQDPLHPVLEIVTSKGTFKVRLDAEKAPITVDNFLDYVTHKQYDQTIFHQVRKDYPGLILGGGYGTDFVEKKAKLPIRNEADNGLKNRRGTIAMARQAALQDSATCHFFINVADNDVLDYKDRTPQGYGYCVFGQVTEGLEVAEQISQVAVQDKPNFEHTPVEMVVIKTVRRIK